MILHTISIYFSDQLCSLVDDLQQKIFGLVRLTSFKCRKSGYSWPEQVCSSTIRSSKLESQGLCKRSGETGIQAFVMAIST